MCFKNLVKRKKFKYVVLIKNSNIFYDRKKFTYDEIRFYVQRLQVYSAIYLDPAIRITNMQAKKAIKVLNKILARSRRKDLQRIPEVRSVINCSLVLVQGYVAHLKIYTSWFVRYKQQRLFSAEATFTKLMTMLIPELKYTVIDTVFDFLKTEQLWKVEFICSEILLSLLSCQVSASDLLTKMLDYLEETLQKNDIKMARRIISIFYAIVVIEFWENQKLKDLERLIRLYHASVKRSYTDGDNQIYQLSRGYEMCLKRICQMLDVDELKQVITVMLGLTFETDLKNDAILDFSNTIEYVAICLKSDLIATVLMEDNLQYLLNKMACKDASISVISCRLLSRLIDRHKNYLNFLTPCCFLVETDYAITVAEDSKIDSSFLKIYRSDFHNAILQAITQHSHYKENVEAIYNLICLFAVEVTSGHAVAAIVCIVVNIQKLAMTTSEMPVIQANHLHATSASLLSLLCWVHRPTSLTTYVQSVINRRYDEAPQLNPPLEMQYQYAKHHVLWHKIELYFDAWELRYGLWKFFRCNEPSINELTDPQQLKKKIKKK